MDSKPKTPQEEKKIERQQTVKLLVFQLATEFGFIIAIPLVVFLLIAKKLNAQYQTKLFFLAAIFLALGLSSYMIYKRLRTLKDLLKDK